MTQVASAAPNLRRLDGAIRPFRVEVPQGGNRRPPSAPQGTRWPERETVAEPTQGVQRRRCKNSRYWATVRLPEVRGEAERLPQFITEIDGLDIHFIHAGRLIERLAAHHHPRLAGLLLEMLNVIGPLTDPAAHGGDAADAFDVVVPSMPGYGFSGKPTATGWDPSTSRMPGLP